MTTTPDDCRQLVSTFIAAREDPGGNASALMDEGFRFESPMMIFDDRNAYLESHRSFKRLVRSRSTISELYGQDQATLLYDLDTATPAGVQRTAEHFRIIDGKVARIVLLFDSAPWRPMFEQARLRS